MLTPHLPCLQDSKDGSSDCQILCAISGFLQRHCGEGKYGCNCEHRYCGNLWQPIAWQNADTRAERCERRLACRLPDVKPSVRILQADNAIVVRVHQGLVLVSE